MGDDDASFAEMRRPFTDPDPLALDEETVERLLAGELPPSQAPPGYARVAALLAATTAEPTPEELAGEAEVLAELRTVTRTRRAGAHARRAGAHTRRAARPPRRRWAGLAAAALVGALVTGGVAAAATGNLPGPVQNVARSILDTAGGVGPGTPTMPAPASTSRASTPGSVQAGQSTRPTGATGPGSATGAAAAPNPNLEGLCQAYLASEGAEQGKKLEATAFQDLAKLAGGAEKIRAYCQQVLAGGATPKEDGKPQPPPGGGQGQGQGGPPTSTGAGNQGQDKSSTTR